MKTKLLILALLTQLFILPASAYDAEINGIYYNFISENEAEVTSGDEDDYDDEGHTYYSGSVVIPESVAYEGVSYRVTSIGYDAFDGCSALTSLRHHSRERDQHRRLCLL